MKRIVLGLCLSVLTLIPAKADEGMWLMMLIKRLNYVDMQKEGLKLTPEEIYSVNNSSLKDAIVSFGGFCTGEIVSDQGLILTNHHCGYSNIAALSTPEHDYLNDGYWAKNKKDEIPVKGLYVRFLIRMGDATERINARLNQKKITEKQRQEIIKEEFEKIEQENNEKGKYTVVVRSFFQGNEFYYFVYQDFTDIRFVGAPPASIGKFGGDTDNWEWPRHTGDFSMFRIYADKAGNPSEYSENNIAYQPKHSLPINIYGIKPGDYAMILGYPGVTSRYLTSYGIQQLVEYEYPPFIEASRHALDILKKHSEKDKAIELNYAGKYASIANYWKNRIGMIEAIKKNEVIAYKEKEEKEFTRWALQSKNKDKYSSVLSSLKNYYQQTNLMVADKMYLFWFLRASSYVSMPNRIGDMLSTYLDQSDEGREAMKPKYIETINSMYETLHPEVEKELAKELLQLYVERVPLKNQLKSISQGKITVNNIENLTESSLFKDKESIINFINHPSKEVLHNDPLYVLSKEAATTLMNKTEGEIQLNDTFEKSQRLFIDGLRKTFPKKVFYPDANSTMRLTYGTVKTLMDNPEKPNDARLNYYTTLKGMIAKYKKGDAEFDLPQKLIDLYNSKDYGDYANEYGELPVDFLSDNDITGGNSGSPVINGNGELIGLAFDGNWEAMSGNIQFDEKLQRCINTDIRFVLFIIEKYAGAENLINEMKIVK
ncbi:S46 family peptidase [Apibacter sp. HY039]|uniref:S46 family peptidase n=1 Tax=Apibacter sp. HY039 TaxID=2501476 RepID=UPI000FEB6C8D|nr:S46 family peptidase [Apibacter sp. HY039]